MQESLHPSGQELLEAHAAAAELLQRRLPTVRQHMAMEICYFWQER